MFYLCDSCIVAYECNEFHLQLVEPAVLCRDALYEAICLVLSMLASSLNLDVVCIVRVVVVGVESSDGGALMAPMPSGCL